eukprot:SAG31_NODE_2177_length_6252_cov_4.841378_3_plen_154_part_00
MPLKPSRSPQDGPKVARPPTPLPPPPNLLNLDHQTINLVYDPVPRYWYQMLYNDAPPPPPWQGTMGVYEKYYDSQKSGQGAGRGFWTDGLIPPTNLWYHISTPGSSAGLAAPRHQSIQNGTHLAKKYRGGVQNAPKLAILINFNSGLIGIIFI